jgi:DMSO/TMAO reductase YedYZ heme-binding membrane subunit
MSHGYRAVTWTPFKARFDRWLIAGIALYLIAFITVSTLVFPPGESFTPIQTLIRATGSLAMIMLTFTLAIGPLARLSPRFKPFLYNRRHIGVATFLIALVHGGLVLLWYHAFGTLNPLVSLLISNPRYDSLSGFPFESLGLAALIILFLMAATSHDFWNNNLGPGLWKALHMGVYLAYGLLVAHVALGAIQMERHPVYVAVLGAGAATLAILHLWTGFAASGARKVAAGAGWLTVGPPLDIADGCATVVQPAQGERIAVFRSGNLIHAVSNVCRHQGGPLGEGRIIDGCITCPWHGFQYLPEDGRSPPPYGEKIATYPTRIRNGIVEVSLTPNPPGTPQPPSVIEEAVS